MPPPAGGPQVPENENEFETHFHLAYRGGMAWSKSRVSPSPFFLPALAVSASLFIAGCGEDAAEKDKGDAATVADAIENYSEIVEASYVDSLAAAEDLDNAISAFLDYPSEDSLDAAREAWLDAREPYLQTEVYRFYDGPIDNPDDGPEGLINAWPLDEAYIDYVEGDETAGIVNDTSVDIDGQTLESMNEMGGEKNIATGYHAIEFLLWGQDQSDDGPGNRPYTDYVEGEDGTAANQDRRAEYLRTVSSLLVGHLEDLVDAWKADESNYRAELTEADEDEQLRRVLTGMIVLSGFETGGERLQTALDSGSQEDEHSCFSDNTHRDMVQDVQGLMNVWSGGYETLDGDTISGTNLATALQDKGIDITSVTLQISEAFDRAEALRPPFDQEIATDNSAGRKRVEDLVSALHEVESLLEDVFRELDLAVPDPG
jgi:putative iron-regulated protein